MTVSYPQKVVFKRLPATDEELWFTVWALWGYRIPRQQVCPNHVAPFDALANAYFARDPMAMWIGSRGLAGKSRTLAVLGLTVAALKGCEVTILGGSFAQSMNVHEATKGAWDWHSSPRHLLAKPPTRYDTVMKHGGHLRTLTASQNSVRGPHPPVLLCDEIDEMDQAVLDAALGQPLEQMNYLGEKVPTAVVLSSTHQHPDKCVTEMKRRSKEQGFPVYEWCLRETSNPVDGWLTEEAIARSKSVMSELMWQTEVLLQEPSFGNRAINTDAVDRAFDKELGEYQKGQPVPKQPKVDGRHYITAVDWAKSRDQTVIVTFDTTDLPWQCVAWQSISQLPWPVLVKRAVDQWRTYGGKLVHDQTGVGAAAGDLIQEMVTTSEFAHVSGIIMGGGRERDSFYTEYVSAIEHDDIRYPRIHEAWDEHRYATPEMLYTSKAHAPDSVVAGALAWHKRRKHVTMVKASGGTRSASPWI